MQAPTTFRKTARHVAKILARELTARPGGAPDSYRRAYGGEERGVVLRGDKVVYLPGCLPDLEHLESKYGEVGSINHYVEQPGMPGTIKLVIMNFND